MFEALKEFRQQMTMKYSHETVIVLMLEGLKFRKQGTWACTPTGMLAGDGRCKTLDAGADGYVRSEGLGLVAMRCVTSLDPTGSDIGGSDILITGSAVNQDGRSSGLTAPNGPSQQNLIRLALSLAHLPPHMVRPCLLIC